MALLAKTFFTQDAVGLRISMTIYTIFQTEVRGTDPFSESLVSMVQQKLKVLVAHHAFVSHALVTPGGDLGMRL